MKLNFDPKVQRRIQNPVKHLRWSVLRKQFAVNYFRKNLHVGCLTGFRFLNTLLKTTIDCNVKPMQNNSNRIQAETYFLRKYHSRQKPVQIYKGRHPIIVLATTNFNEKDTRTMSFNVVAVHLMFSLNIF